MKPKITDRRLVESFTLFDGPQQPHTSSTAPVLGALIYRIVVECDSETHQASILKRLESEGLRCRPLIS